MLFRSTGYVERRSGRPLPGRGLGRTALCTYLGLLAGRAQRSLRPGERPLQLRPSAAASTGPTSRERCPGRGSVWPWIELARGSVWNGKVCRPRKLRGFWPRGAPRLSEPCAGSRPAEAEPAQPAQCAVRARSAVFGLAELPVWPSPARAPDQPRPSQPSRRSVPPEHAPRFLASRSSPSGRALRGLPTSQIGRAHV